MKNCKVIQRQVLLTSELERCILPLSIRLNEIHVDSEPSLPKAGPFDVASWFLCLSFLNNLPCPWKILWWCFKQSFVFGEWERFPFFICLVIVCFFVTMAIFHCISPFSPYSGTRGWTVHVLSFTPHGDLWGRSAFVWPVTPHGYHGFKLYCPRDVSLGLCVDSLSGMIPWIGIWALGRLSRWCPLSLVSFM